MKKIYIYILRTLTNLEFMFILGNYSNTSLENVMFPAYTLWGDSQDGHADSHKATVYFTDDCAILTLSSHH